jgi:iron complex outermembrane receptor protein
MSASSHIRILLLCLLAAFRLHAQSKDTVSVKEVELVYQRNAIQKGLHQTKLDSASLALNSGQSIGELLSSYSPIYIKAYGPGSLSTPAFRGAASEHTRIFWNGMPLNSPMLGLSDLNLIPVFLIDDVSLDYGNASLLHGSGGIGGSLSLNSGLISKPYIMRLQQTVGSFGKYQTFAKGYYGGKKLTGSTAVYYGQAKNDFPYTDYFGKLKHDTNAAFLQYGVMQQIAYSLDSNNRLEATAWLQNTQRGIPPLIGSLGLDEHQQDKSYRGSIRYTRQARQKWFFTMGYNKEYLLYEIRKYGSSSLSDFTSWVGKAEQQGRINSRVDYYNSIEAGYDEAFVKDYVQPRTRAHATALTRWNFKASRTITIGVLLRPDWVETYKPVLPGALTASWSALPKGRLQLYANAGHNYRFPTLNERYWVPGGNPNLQPEKSYTLEGGANAIVLNRKHLKIEMTGDAYSNRISGFIEWQPVNATVWSPFNLSRVWARGGEASLSIQVPVRKHTFSLQSSGAFTRSQEDTATAQLPYVPVWNFRNRLRWQAANWIAEAEYNYISGVNAIGGDPLPGYGLLNAQIVRNIDSRHLLFSLHLRVNNLLNTTYQVMENRPMPGRYFEINLQINLKP